jgi:hypothetical protein
MIALSTRVRSLSKPSTLPTLNALMKPPYMPK